MRPRNIFLAECSAFPQATCADLLLAFVLVTLLGTLCFGCRFPKCRRLPSCPWLKHNRFVVLGRKLPDCKNVGPGAWQLEFSLIWPLIGCLRIRGDGTPAQLREGALRTLEMITKLARDRREGLWRQRWAQRAPLCGFNPKGNREGSMLTNT